MPFMAARAAWDPDGNRLSSQPRGSVVNHAAMPFGEGGVLAVWATYDAANDNAGEIRAQALDYDGNVLPVWPAQGVLLAHAPGVGQFPALIPDGAGGAYVLWWMVTAIGNFRIQHLTRTGAIASGWPAAGLALAGYIHSGIRLAPDGAGGVYVATHESPVGVEGASRLRRLDPEGNTAAGWPVDGVALDLPPGYFGIDLAPDGEGGVYAAWAEKRETGHYVIVLHRYTAAAMAHPLWPPGGVRVGDSGDPSHYVGASDLILDGTGGLYVGWSHSGFGCMPCDEACPCPGQYVTRLEGNGAVASGWTAAGLYVGEAGENVPDGAGGLLIGTTSSQGEVQHSRDYRALVVRVGPDGSAAPGWSLSGNPVCANPRGQRPPAVAPDGAGGVFVSWADTRVDLAAAPYVSRLTASGSIADGWPAEGCLVSAAARWVDRPQLVPGRAGEAIVLWSDFRSGQYQLYATGIRAASAGLLAAPGVDVTDIRPNPAIGGFWANVSVREPEAATLELLDLGGRRIESWTVAGGRKSAMWVHTSRTLAPGLYWLRLRQGSGPASAARVMILR